jgi:hypothetical protein
VGGGIFGKFQAASLGARRPGTFSKLPENQKIFAEIDRKACWREALTRKKTRQKNRSNLTPDEALSPIV